MKNTKDYWISKKYKNINEFICLNCKTTFYKPSFYLGKVKFCSHKCNTTYKNLNNNPMNNLETRKKMSLTKKGSIPWQKKLKEDDTKLIEYKKNMSLQQSILRKGQLPWNKGGNILTDIRIKKYGNKLRGKQNGMWRGGKSLRDYRGTSWNSLRLEILIRDNYTCQECKTHFKSPKLHIHHKIPYRYTKDNSKNNLITLCESCHHKIENKNDRN